MGEVIETHYSKWHGGLELAGKEIAEKVDSLNWREKRVVKSIYNYLAARFDRNPQNYVYMLQRDLHYIAPQQLSYWLNTSVEDVINLHTWVIYMSEITTKKEV